MALPFLISARLQDVLAHWQQQEGECNRGNYWGHNNIIISTQIYHNKDFRGKNVPAVQMAKSICMESKKKNMINKDTEAPSGRHSACIVSNVWTSAVDAINNNIKSNSKMQQEQVHTVITAQASVLAIAADLFLLGLLSCLLFHVEGAEAAVDDQQHRYEEGGHPRRVHQRVHPLTTRLPVDLDRMVGGGPRSTRSTNQGGMDITLGGCLSRRHSGSGRRSGARHFVAIVSVRCATKKRRCKLSMFVVD